MSILFKTRIWAALSGAAVLVFGLQAQAQDQITYADHVAKIINENCVVCHREGGIGPMQFETFDQVRPWAPLIQMKVANREMPPYAYDHGIGIQDLQGDWRLAQEDIDTIVNWVDQGAPLGNWGDREPLVADIADVDEWNFAGQFGPPSLIIPSIAIDIPANGTDLWHKHHVPTGVTQDRCIQAIQVKPRGDAKSVVHHANSDVEVLNEDGEYEKYGQLTEYAMGKWGEIMPPGVCRTIPANSRVAWDIHMFPGGVGGAAQNKAVLDNVVEIGIWFHDEDFIAQTDPYKQDLRLYGIRGGYVGGQLIVPPNGTTMTQGFHSFDHPVRIDSFQPHGHLRMNAASLEIFYPETGRTEAISQISKWSATWHHSHLYETESAPLLPAGAVLVIKQWYDNTANNPNNPDPDQWVFGGSRTGDEMSHAWIAVTHLDEEGYEGLLAERTEADVD
jgi:mono/diheme cytochrome c family protein